VTQKLMQMNLLIDNSLWQIVVTFPPTCTNACKKSLYGFSSEWSTSTYPILEPTNQDCRRLISNGLFNATNEYVLQYIPNDGRTGDKKSCHR